MSLPELPSEKQITKWLQSLWREIGRYVRTVWLSLRSPTSLVRHSMHDRSIRALPFALFTLVFASLLLNGAIKALGVDKPFFGDFAYYTRFLAYNHAITSLEKFLPGRFSGSIVLSSLQFIIVLLVVVFWARVLAGRTRRYWTDVAALSYLLPVVLIAHIVVYCAINLVFRMIGESVLLFAGAVLLIPMLSAVIVYGIVLRVVDQVYFARGWQRVIHITGYVMFVPVVLCVLYTARYMVPVGFYAYRAINPTVEGNRKLHAGDYEAAEKLYERAIQNDVTGLWSGGARIRLISVDARLILALLPNLSYDSGLRERLHRRLEHTDPFRRVMEAWREVEAWRPKGKIGVTPERLLEFRDAILYSYLTAGDIPVTNSELDCALRTTAADEGCGELSREAITRYANKPAQRQRLYYLIYRARALKGEPTTTDTRRYLQFLAELPIRIELLFVRYRALNLMRDSETLASLDDQNRLLGILDRDNLIKANREIRNQGAKYTHLRIPDAQIERLSDRELGFLFRQAYLSYLQSESRLLATSRACGESSLIRQRVASIEEHLKWVAKDVIYRDVPPADRLDQELLKLFGLGSDVVITNKGQGRGASP